MPTENMEPEYDRIRTMARRIAFRYPTPDFYLDHIEEYVLSRRLFGFDPVISGLQRAVAPSLSDNKGHGMKHSLAVALDAGALIVAEGKKLGGCGGEIRRKVLMAHCAGLLHDIERKKKNHAEKGAVRAVEILKDYPLSKEEVEDIRLAIRNHEAFKSPLKIDTADGAMLSACLYDADKFRWGPDNFTDTIWDMVTSARVPLKRFMELYPSGMEHLERIKTTFRSDTGKIYGPRFIDMGLSIGRELYIILETGFEDTRCRSSRHEKQFYREGND